MGTQFGCVVCNSSLCELIAEAGDRLSFNCQVCGRYDVSSSAFKTSLNPQSYQLTPIQRSVLSYRIRQANDAGKEPPILTTYDVDDVTSNGRLPTPAQQATNIIRYFGNLIADSGQPVHALPASFGAIVGSPNRDFALRIAKQLAQFGLITAIDCREMQSPNEIMDVDLTLAGWAEYEKERRGAVIGRLWFHRSEVR